MLVHLSWNSSSSRHNPCICAHPGWGESLLLNVVFPDVPVLSYQEYFYNLNGFDFDFDPEFSNNSSLFDKSKLVLKNTHLLSVLESSTHNVTPTQFQKNSYPASFHEKFSVIHDGVKLPDLSIPARKIKISDTILGSSSKIITFINRTLEPYRDVYSFV